MPVPERYIAQFVEGHYFHVFNRSIGNRLLFRCDKDYGTFIFLIRKYLLNQVDLYCYCLIPNHFHLLLKVHEDVKHEDVVNSFRSLFIAFTNRINAQYGERGGLFQTPFRRVEVADDCYFTQLAYYIHLNPVHHKLRIPFEQYRWSSYLSYINPSPSFIKRKECLEWFGGKQAFEEYHLKHQELYLEDIQLD